MMKVSQFAASALVLSVLTGTLPGQSNPQPGTATPAAPGGVPAATAPVRPTGVAATVNGQPIPEAAVARALLSVESRNRDKARPEILNFLIDNALVDQYLAYQKLAADPKEVDAKLAEMKAEVKKQGQDYVKLLENLLITEVELKEQIAGLVRWEKFVSAQASDEKLKAFFEQNIEMFDGTLVRARHILLTAGADAAAKQQAVQELRDIRAAIETEVAQALARLPMDADAVSRDKERLKIAEDAFAKKAHEKSTCPSKRDGGDLGWFPRAGSMVEPFARAAFALKTGQISDVVTTEFGYHLVLVTARKAGQPTKFEDVKDAVKEIYGNKLREAVTAQMRARAKIDIAPVN